MNTTLRIFGFELKNVARSRWLFAYAGFFYLATDALLRFSSDAGTAALSMMNVVLMIVPLVTAVFATMYVYNAREFTELLLAQPVNRRQLYVAQVAGLTLPLAAALAVGIALPFVMHRATAESMRAMFALVVSGVALTAVFTGIACVAAGWIEDRVRGLGAVVAAWLFMAVLYDAMVLFIALSFADYPVERGMLAMMLANPIDLARIVMLLEFDISALMGYTGAVFKRFFGTVGGMVLAAGALSLWVMLPATLGLRIFRRRDF
jgi:Cu-processing system permease protein